MKPLFSNIVDKKNLQDVQLKTLSVISKTLANTAGPYGSNTIILGDPGKGKPDTYTKDGHKTLSHIDFFDPLEKSIQTQLIEVTEHIVKTVGDGTTSTVMMCASVYSFLYDYMTKNNKPIFKIVQTIDDVITDIQKRIKEHGRDIDLFDIYDICMISTNGNKEISTELAAIYRTYGKNVYINVTTSNTSENIIKAYDGLTLERGYASPAYINSEEGNVTIRNPRLYTFTDPIDTPEMISYMEKIIYENIIVPYSNGKVDDYKPTVIMAPTISRDATSVLVELEKLLYASPNFSKPPILIITGLNKEIDQYNDIVTLCGDKSIKKYINPDIQEKDIADGKAPSIDNVIEWYGTCDEIICDNMKTKFINPKDMFSDEVDEDGNRVYGKIYEGLLNFVEQELEYSIKNGESIGVIGNLKRRLNCLKSNLVDYMIGGISIIDRDSVKDLVEDAVLNCRSAVRNGVGYGSNFEGLRACYELISEMEESDKSLRYDMLIMIYKAYYEVIENLYRLNYDGDPADLIESNLKEDKPINLRTLSWDKEQVLCSIDSDIAMLDAIKKVIVPMVTANQALLLTPQHNKYLNLE